MSPGNHGSADTVRPPMYRPTRILPDHLRVVDSTLRGHRPIRPFPWRANPAVLNGIVAGAYGRPMSIIATIMNSATGQPIQKMTFQRMPKPWVTFHLATGEMVTADRVNVGQARASQVHRAGRDLGHAQRRINGPSRSWQIGGRNRTRGHRLTAGLGTRATPFPTCGR